MADQTDVTGRNFISYRRYRREEATRLVRALHVHGVPCWQDVENLGPHGTEDQIRRTLEDPATASALVWITPEVVDSAFMRGIEAPLIVRRAVRGDGFFGVLVAAGGLEPGEAGAIVAERVTDGDPRWWNVHHVTSDPLDVADATAVARSLGRLRLEAIHARLAPDLPLRIGLDTWRRPPARASGMALQLDWAGAFRDPHFPDPTAWRDELQPALEWLAEAVAVRCPGRTVQFEAHMSLSVAMALGYHLRQTTGVRVVFRHEYQGRQTDWSATVPPEDSHATVTAQHGDPSSGHVAVLVSATQAVETAFTNSRGSLPTFRGVIRVTWSGATPGAVMTPGQGRDLAERVRQALIAGQTELSLRRGRSIHVFAAGPAPLAMLIGIQMNTLAPLTVYELITGEYSYAPALTIAAPSRGEADS